MEQRTDPNGMEEKNKEANNQENAVTVVADVAVAL
jgi:hypothetical protein